MRRKEIAVRNYNMFIAAVLCGVVLTLTACGGGGGGSVTGPSGPVVSTGTPNVAISVYSPKAPDVRGVVPAGSVRLPDGPVAVTVGKWYDIYGELGNTGGVTKNFKFTSTTMDGKIIPLINSWGVREWSVPPGTDGGSIAQDFVVTPDFLTFYPGGQYQIRLSMQIPERNMTIEKSVDLIVSR